MKHRSFILVVLFLSLLFGFASGAFAGESSTENEEFLSVGRSTVWPLRSGEQVSLSDDSIVRIVDQGTSLKIIGKKIGTAVIKTESRSLQVSVLPEVSFRVARGLSEAVKDKRGLVISNSTGQLQVSGRLLRLGDWVDIAEHVRGVSPDVYSFAAVADTSLDEKIKTHFKTILRESGLPDLDVQLSPIARVTVPAEPKDLKERVAHVLGAYGFKVDTAVSALSLEPMVRVKIVVAEVKKNMEKHFGIKWPESVTAQLLPALSLDNSLSITLQAIEANGWGQVLASPTLLCRSGKEASFLAGGEFPIKIANFKTQDVIWKKYGVLLGIKPVADFHGRMSIAIETEVSMIDDAHKVDGIPGLFTNRIETHFDLSSTRTIALSGLIKKAWSENSQGLPGLGTLPILGPLFSSRDYKDDRSELIIFVTPEIADPNEVGS